MPVSTLDYTKFENKIKCTYPSAYKEYQSHFKAPFELINLYAFFRWKKIQISSNYTNAINPNFEGTYNFKVTIENKEDLEKLDRSINKFSYYGLSSYEKAYFKALTKAFEIVNSLIIGKTMPQKIGRRYQN